MSELRFTEQTTPALPPPGRIKLYVDEVDGHCKQIDENGNIIDFTAGSVGEIIPAKGVQFTLDPAPAHSEGLLFYDIINKSLSFYNNEVDVTLQIGQEVWLRAVNNTGSTITNGMVVYISGSSGLLPEIDLANANAAPTALPMIGIATHDIIDGAVGIITRSGTVRELDTSSFTAGQLLFLDTIDGGITTTPPVSPNYRITIGTASVIDANSGTIEVNVDIASNTSDVIKIFNGSVLENTNVDVASDGAIVSLSLEKDGGGDLSLFFDGAFTFFESTPAASVNLSAGSDSAPTENFIYIPKSTGVLSANINGFPTNEQIVPVATVVVQSPASVQSDGCYKCHKWSDNLSDDVGEGHVSHINSWIRRQHATWKEGISPTTTITVNGGAIDDVDFQVTSGIALQLHSHTFPARNTATGDPVYVANDSTTLFDKIASLDAIDTTSLGVTLRDNNTFYSIVIWGVVSEDEPDCKLYANSPSGSYSSSADALVDPLGFNDFTIPEKFRGAGFLIARVVLRYQTASSGTITLISTEDLRGLIPSSAPGGGSSLAGTEFSDNLFRVQNVSDNTKELAFDVSSVTTATVRTINIPDRSGDIMVDNFIDTIKSGATQGGAGAAAGEIWKTSGHATLPDNVILHGV